MRTRPYFSSLPVFAALVTLAATGIAACSDSNDGEAPSAQPGEDAGNSGDAGQPTPAEDSGSAPPEAGGPITVSGRVIDANGLAIPSATVSVAGQPLVYTALDGTFAVTGVTTPYDVTVLTTVNGILFTHTFVELTTPTPEILPYVPLDVGAPPEQAVEGTLGAPVPVNHRARVCIEGLAQPVYGCDDVLEGESSYSINATWVSGPSSPVRVHAMLFSVNPTTQAIIGYAGAGSKTATLFSSSTSVTVNLAIGSAPAKATLNTSVNAPPGQVVSGATASVRLGQWLDFPLEARTAPTNATSFAATFEVPVIPGSSYSILAASGVDDVSSFAWNVGLAAGANAAPKLPRPPQLTSPTNAATGVTTGTTFVADNPEGLPLTFMCIPQSPQHPVFTVSTSKSTARLPALDGIGVPLPSGAVYGCSLIGAGSAGARPDTLVSGGGPIGALNAVQLSQSKPGGAGFATSGSLTLPGDPIVITTQ